MKSLLTSVIESLWAIQPFRLAVLILITVVLTMPYQTYTNDHNFYIPAIERSYNKTQFSTPDIFSTYSQTADTYFDELIVAQKKLINNTSVILFINTLLILYAFFYFIEKITFTLTNHVSISRITPFLVGSSYFFYLNNFVLVPRVMAVTLGIAAIYYLLKRQSFVAGIFLACAVCIHVITASYFLLVCILFLIRHIQKDSWKPLVHTTILPIGAIAVLYLQSTTALQLYFDPELYALAHTWTPYIFAATSIPVIASACFMIACVLFFHRLLKNSQNDQDISIIYISIISAILFWLINVIGIITNLHIILVLQFARMIPLGFLFIIIGCLYILSKKNELFEQNKLFFFLFMMTFVSLLYGAESNWVYALPGTLTLLTCILLAQKNYLWPYILGLQYLAIGLLLFVVSTPLHACYFFFFSILSTLLVYGHVYHKPTLAITGTVLVVLIPITLLFLVTWKGFLADWEYMYNLPRVFSVIIVSVAFVYLVSYLTQEHHHVNYVRSIFIFTCVACMIVLGKNFSIYPGFMNDRDFIALCESIKNTTPYESVFYVLDQLSVKATERHSDPFVRYTPLRESCDRNQFGTPTDAAQIILNKVYATSFSEAMHAVERIPKHPSFEAIQAVLLPHHVDYVITDAPLANRPQPDLRQGIYYVYSLEKQPDKAH